MPAPTSFLLSLQPSAGNASLSVTEAGRSAEGRDQRGAKTQLTASPSLPVSRSLPSQCAARSPRDGSAEGTGARSAATPGPSPLSTTEYLLRLFVAHERVRREVADVVRDDGDLVDAIDCELAGRRALEIVREGRW